MTTQKSDRNEIASILFPWRQCRDLVLENRGLVYRPLLIYLWFSCFGQRKNVFGISVCEHRGVHSSASSHISEAQGLKSIIRAQTLVEHGICNFLIYSLSATSCLSCFGQKPRFREHHHQSSNPGRKRHQQYSWLFWRQGMSTKEGNMTRA